MNIFDGVKSATTLSLTTITFLFCGCEHPATKSPEKAAAEVPVLVWDARGALKNLTTINESAAILAKEAKGIMVFPSVTKAGLLVGGFHGDGVLLRNGAAGGYYKT